MRTPAAAALAVAAGVDKDVISQGFCDFEGLPHRLSMWRNSME